MREPAVLKALARRIENRLRGVRPQAVFSPSSIPMTFVDPRWPAMFAADQVFGDFLETYIRAPARRFARLGHAQEQRALRLARRASYPSHWAARSAVRPPWRRPGPHRCDSLGRQPAAGACRGRGRGGDRGAADEKLPSGLYRPRLAAQGRPAAGPDRPYTERHRPARHRHRDSAVRRRAWPSSISKSHPFLDKGRPEHFAILPGRCSNRISCSCRRAPKPMARPFARRRRSGCPR